MSNGLLYLGALVLAILAALFAVPYVIDWNSYRSVFEEEATRILGRDVRVAGSVNVRLLPAPFVRFERLRIADISGTEPLFRADSLTVWLSLAPLLRGALEASEVEVKRPVLRLVVNPDGTGNWKSLTLNPASFSIAPTEVAFQQVNVTEGQAGIFTGAGAELLRLGQINGTLSAEGLDGPYKFRGTGLWRGGERDIRLATSRPDADGSVRVKAGVRVKDTGSSYVFDGRLADLRTHSRIDGELSAKLTLVRAGEDASAALTKAKPGKSGAAGAGDADGGLAFDLKSRLEGDGKGLALKDLALSYEQSGQPQLVTGEARAGWAEGETAVDLTLASRWLDLDKISEAASVGHPIETSRGLIKAIVAALPDSGRANARLSVDQVNLAGEAVGNVAVHIARARGPLELKELKADLPGGSRLALRGYLHPEKEGAAPAFSGQVALHGTSLARAASWAEPGQTLVGARNDSAYAMHGLLRLGEQSFDILEATGELGGQTVRGEVRYATTGRRELAVAVQGNTLDLSNLWPGALNLATPLARFATPPAAGALPLDLKIKVRAGALSDGERALGDVEAELVQSGDALRVGRLRFQGEDGLAVDIEGDVTGLAKSPRGALKGVVAAGGAKGARALLQLWDGASAPDALSTRIAGLAPFRVAGTLSLGDGAGAGEARLEGDGVARGGRLAVVARLADGAAPWRERAADLSIRVDGGPVVALGRALAGSSDEPARAAAEPSDGVLEIKSAGRIASGMASIVRLQRPGLNLSYDGLLSLDVADALALRGTLAVGASDAARTSAHLLGVNLLGGLDAPLPLSGTLEIARDANGWSAKTYQLALGATRIAGSARVEPRGAKPTRVSADLDVSAASVAGLLAIALDERQHRAVEPSDTGLARSIWPSRPFDLARLDAIEGEVVLRIPRLAIEPGLTASAARLKVQLAPQRIDVTSIEAKAAGGLLTGVLSLDKAPAGAAVAGQIKLAGAKLEEVVGPAAKGPLGASVSFSGRATSPEALLTVMAGKGEIELGAARLHRFSPQVIARTVDAQLAAKADAPPQPLKEALLASLATGDLKLGPRKIAIDIADGAAKVQRFKIEAEGGTTTGEITLDLSTLHLDSEWRIESSEGAKPRANVQGLAGLPPVTVVYVGAARDLSLLEPRLSTDALERELTVRRMERDVEELERLRKLDEERAKAEAERQKAIEAERQRAAEEAAAARAAAAAAAAASQAQGMNAGQGAGNPAGAATPGSSAPPAVAAPANVPQTAAPLPARPVPTPAPAQRKRPTVDSGPQFSPYQY